MEIMNKIKCFTGSWSLDLGGKGYKKFGLDGHIFNSRWIFLYREGDNNCSISKTILVITPQVIVVKHIIFLLQKPEGIRRGCSVSKRLVKLTVPGLPLAAAWISRSTSVIICVELFTLIHRLDAHQCKIWRLEKLHLSGKTQYFKYYLQWILQNINKFAAGQTKPILANTKSSRSHEFCREFWGIF